MKATELYIIIQHWNEIPDEFYVDKAVAEKTAIDKLNAWKDLMYNEFTGITSNDIQDCLKLSTTVNKFDVMTLNDWILYHVKPIRVMSEMKQKEDKL